MVITSLSFFFLEVHRISYFLCNFLCNFVKELFDCLDPSSMNYIGIRFDEYVRPVDVEITAIGYTKE